jgi:hypothetical protein
MTGDESGDLALALGLFAFLFTVGLCIFLRKAPHFVWKRLKAREESRYAVSSHLKKKTALNPIKRKGVHSNDGQLTGNLLEVVQTAGYVTHHITHHHAFITHHPSASIAHRSPFSSLVPRLTGKAMVCTCRTLSTPRGLNAPW